MNKTLELDLVILGGGIAGLWTLNRAIQAGYNAVLFEQASLGGGQTVHSQGIIHGGIKYALNGVLTPASNTIKEMPTIWRDCLKGTGQLDLSAVNVLSDAHYMWSKKSVGARLTTFFASKALSGRVSDVPKGQRPEVFQNPGFKGSLYRLNELVLDVPDLISKLSEPVKNRIFKAGSGDYKLLADSNNQFEIELPQQQLLLKPKHIVSTCGEGYQQLIQNQNQPLPEMQRRPLQMVMVKHNTDLPLYAHCFAGGTRPVMTVTTHYTKAGETVWYLGGDLAEKGIELTPEQQIKAAQQTLAELLPWVKLENSQWKTVSINRAEPKQSSLTLPDAAYTHQVENLIIAWPTKLALAPDLSDKVLASLPAPGGGSPPQELNGLLRPNVADALWENFG